MSKSTKKNVLTIRDFSILYSLTTREISDLESNAEHIEYFMAKCMTDEEIDKERKRRKSELKENIFYQDLLCVRERLGNLNIEIEVPSVEVKNESN